MFAMTDGILTQRVYCWIDDAAVRREFVTVTRSESFQKYLFSLWEVRGLVWLIGAVVCLLAANRGQWMAA